MSTMSKTVPATSVIAVRPSAYRTSLTKQAQYQIERLTESLFYRKGGLHCRSILMVDLGGSSSSRWVATGVASVLGKAIPHRVHVLAVGSNVSEIHPASEGNELDSYAGSCILECIADPTSRAEGMNVLRDRLLAIKADGLTSIIHLSQSKQQVINLPCMDFVDGVVLLVRAAQTRRAALEAIERQLATAGTPLLGSVLLDRDYPIPEKLYRLL
jgi:hypothetical protein